ncbi:MAG: TonB-dependent receptor [Thermoanaerobaculales bacterium]|nr:TonB-dependent receptor [Thermoanaerobaculales bacterium]
MRKFAFVFVVVAACLFMALPSFAQMPSGTLSGRVSQDGTALPGVTVMAESPSMQGQKTAITGATGDYMFRFLPPGDYTITFALDGFRTLEIPVRVSVAQSKTIDAAMYLEAMEEEIIVTGDYETVSTGVQSSVTIEQDLLEQLPIARTIQNAVLLTPGTSASGPNNNITISGSQSYENLYLINGVVVNENVRGQAQALYIEDAVEQTTTSTSGVSAEYGRFAGGVVNMITKSGGNEFSGSYRLNLTNDSWNGKTPETTEQVDETNLIHEATLGGFIMKDSLWFFLAGRDRSLEGSGQLYNGFAYPTGDDQTRLEAKLTWSPHVSHRFIGSYVDVDHTQTNDDFLNSGMEPSHIDPERTLPNTLMALNYTGVLSDNFFVEGQYSKREYAFVDSGGSGMGDRINGTEINVYGYGRAGAATFCGDCGDETRDNEDFLAKASWFLATEGMGSHDIVGGFDTFTDLRLSNNYQTPSNFRMYIYDGPAYDPAGTFYPILGDYVEIDYWPIFTPSMGAEYATDSLYVNDTWRFSDRLTINMGLRYDSNDGVDGSGAVVADDSRVSPRLGLSWDVKGDGDWVVNASAARYVTAIANTVASQGGAGVPSWMGYLYGGPQINVGCSEETPELCTHTTPEAMAVVFDWFDSVGGLGNTDLWYASPAIRGVNQIVSGLKSPYTDEYSIGVTKRLGNKGLFRVDLVHRESHDFYVMQRDATTGTVHWEDELEGAPVSADFDLGYMVNEDNLLSRKYDGLHTMAQYRISDALQVGATWTWSHTRGNMNGETAGGGPGASGVLNYPEYQRAEWSYPTGSLLSDQRHKVRGWLVWDVISTSSWNLNVSWLENFWTGTPYGSLGSVLVGAYNTPEGVPDYLQGPGYWGNYYFENRDTYRTDDIHRSDLAVNISFFVGDKLEFYLQPEVLNIFGEEGVTAVNTTVTGWKYDRDLENFNPFTETPEEGVHWYKEDEFGLPTGEGDYQAPRTVRFSVGVRF